MSDSNADLLRGAYDAFGRGDIAGVMAVLADDVEWHAPDVLPQGMDARGKEEVGAFFEKLVGTWEGLSLDIEDFCASGNRVCVIGKASGQLDGVETGYGFVHAWTVADGLCTRFHEYVDPEPEMLAG